MELEKNLQYLMDRFAIQDVITKYSFGQDLHQGNDNNILDTWKDVFTENAVLDYQAAGSEPTSYQKMAQIMRGDGINPGNMSSFSNWQHLVGNPVVTIDGDVAIARTDLWATHKGKVIDGKSAPSLYVAAAFSDELVRTKDGWRISFRKLELHFMDMVNTL